MARFVDLRTWLEANDPELFRELYDSTLELPTDPDLAHLLNAKAIRENLDRLQRHNDVGDAAAIIGTAKDLIESTAKVILTAEGQTPGERADLPTLIKRTHEALDLHVGTANNVEPAIEAAVKKIRGGLQAIVLGVVELRNAAGTGHGKEQPSPSGLADDARLAADATAAWIRSVLGAYSELTNERI